MFNNVVEEKRIIAPTTTQDDQTVSNHAEEYLMYWAVKHHFPWDAEFDKQMFHIYQAKISLQPPWQSAPMPHLT